MQVTNPLVPPATGQAGGASAPVANAPAAAETAKAESARPVTAARESDGGRNEPQREPDAARDDSRGQRLDLEV